MQIFCNSTCNLSFKIKSLKRIIVIICVLIGIASCNTDDDLDSITFEVCEDAIQIEEVVVNNVSIQGVDNTAQRGYLLNATVVNNTNSEIQNGRVIITFFANNNPFTFNALGNCSTLDPNSNCSFFSFLPISATESIDQNPVVACFYYKL